MVLVNLNTDTIVSNIWNNFYSLIDDNVNSVTIYGSGGPDTKTVIIQGVSSSFPDNILEDSSKYPLITIYTPTLDEVETTFRANETNATIEIEVLTTQAEAADKFLDLINKTIRDNEANLREVGIEELYLTDTVADQFTRGGAKIHSRKAVWGFKAFV
jgi:hypothetical protein